MNVRRWLFALLGISVALPSFPASHGQYGRPDIALYVSDDVAPSSSIKLTINTKNLNLVHLVAYPIDAVRWLRGTRAGVRNEPVRQGRAAASWNSKLDAANGEKAIPGRDTYYTRTINMPRLGLGVYELVATPVDKRSTAAPASAVITVTDLSVVLKHTASRSLVWITDIRGRLVAGARVRAFDASRRLIGDAVSKADGCAILPQTSGRFVYVVSRGRAFAGLSADSPNPDGQLRPHFQTDRPIYRPGQTIHFKVILRTTLGQGYRVEAGKVCQVRLVDPKNNPVDAIDLTSNAMGTIHGEMSIPTEGMLGGYSLVAHTPYGDAYDTVGVAAYRKPQFKVDVTPLARRYLAGETGTFRIKAAYYFGTPVQGAAVHYTIRWSPAPFELYRPRYRVFRNGNGNLYPRDTYAFGGFVADNTVATDEHGQVDISFPTQTDGDAVYSVSATVVDQTRQQVAGSGSVPVFSAAIRIGLDSDVGYTLLGRDIPVDVEVRDLDGHPVGARVELELSGEEWNDKESKYEQKTYIRRSVGVPGSGHLRATLPAVREGSLTVTARAKDSTGRIASAHMTAYVASPYQPPYTRFTAPHIDVRLDKASYTPGDLIHAYITTTNPGTPMLITVEGAGLWLRKVIAAPKRGQAFDFRATTALSPNAFLFASQWVDHQLLTGQTEIEAPNPANTITVEVKPDRPDYRPGDKATLTVRTSDRRGHPVSAEVALAVVDEAIYALSPDSTVDPYGLYWGDRGNAVGTVVTRPIEMEGGAYQRTGTVAPLRQRFEDTADWVADLTTGPDGTGTTTFEMPGNLTTWRASALAVDQHTSVGTRTTTVVANRLTMLRLATPRQIVQGDRLTLVTTIDNRSSSDHEYDLTLRGEGLSVRPVGATRVRIPAQRQAKVQWALNASSLPESGESVLIGQAVATDVPSAERADLSDAVEARIPVVPKGVRERVLRGGVFDRDGSLVLTMPEDRIEPASVVSVRIWRGMRAALGAAADQVMQGGRWGSPSAADQLAVAAETGLGSKHEAVRESLALISRAQRGDGWGWWDESPSTPSITARVLGGLSAAHAAKLDTYTNLLFAARAAANYQFAQTNQWEDRAQLAAALLDSGDPDAPKRVDEVLNRGQRLSPYAKLRLAEALAPSQAARARLLVQNTLSLVSNGPESAFLPTGEGVGWTADDSETTAQMLSALVRLGMRPQLQAKLVRWLIEPLADGWRSQDDYAAIVHALSLFVHLHPEAPAVDAYSLIVNGASVPLSKPKLDDAAVGTIPRSLLRSGANRIEVHNGAPGLTFYTVDAAVFEPRAAESVRGIRVLRRLEVQNAAGVWQELRRPVHPGEPVRCTVVAWGDDLPDAVRIVEPLPSGFELIDDETGGWGRSEVRDAAVIHYLVNAGSPTTFRYYIRAESEGTLSALPATAEYLRRPADRGRSGLQVLEVREAP